MLNFLHVFKARTKIFYICLQDTHIICSVVVIAVRWFFLFNISVDVGTMMLLFVFNPHSSFQAIAYCVDMSFIQFLGLLNISLYIDTPVGLG
jgi:hypothetical protein